MADHEVEVGKDGQVDGGKHSAGQEVAFVVRTLEVERRYHDDTPVQGATAYLKYPTGLELKAELNTQGKAVFRGVPAGDGQLRFGPDARSYERAEKTPNPDHPNSKKPGYIDGLLQKYGVTPNAIA